VRRTAGQEKIPSDSRNACRCTDDEPPFLSGEMTSRPGEHVFVGHHLTLYARQRDAVRKDVES
jgi:hypothetical protein